MEGIFFRLVKYNDSIHPDQFRQKFPHENHQEPQGVYIKRLAHACVRMKGFANWAAMGFLLIHFQRLKLKYNNSLLVIEIWIIILRFFLTVLGTCLPAAGCSLLLMGTMRRQALTYKVWAMKPSVLVESVGIWGWWGWWEGDMVVWWFCGFDRTCFDRMWM